MAPIAAATATTNGNGACNTEIAQHAATAIAHRPPFVRVRAPIRNAACTTSAVTAGLIPAKTALTTGTVPKRKYVHASAIRITKEGNTNSTPAAIPPRVRCISQPI